VPAAPATSPSLVGPERAAVLLLALGPAVCAAVLRQLPEDDVEAITARMARIESVAPSVVEEVLKDYERALATHDIQIAGSIHNVREALTEAFGRDQAVKLLDRLTKTLSEEESQTTCGRWNRSNWPNSSRTNTRRPSPLSSRTSIRVRPRACSQRCRQNCATGWCGVCRRSIAFLRTRYAPSPPWCIRSFGISVS
jgi:hypothetical protein